MIIADEEASLEQPLFLEHPSRMERTLDMSITDVSHVFKKQQPEDTEMLFSLADAIEKTRVKPNHVTKDDKRNQSLDENAQSRSIDLSGRRKSRIANFSHISDLPRKSSSKNISIERKSHTSGTMYTTPKQLQEKEENTVREDIGMAPQRRDPEIERLDDIDYDESNLQEDEIDEQANNEIKQDSSQNNITFSPE